MSNLFSLTFEPDENRVIVTGELTFSSVNSLLKQSDVMFQSIAPLHIDLANIVRSDSAGLALLIHWIRNAYTENKEIVFQHIPAQLLAIASASDLNLLLPSEQ